MQYKKIIKYTVFAIVFGIIFCSYFARFEGPATGYWDTYITAPAIFMTNQAIDFVSKNGKSLYNYSLPGRLPENLVDKQTYGIISKDQRLGSAILFAPWFLFFNMLGFRILFTLSGVATAFFTFMTLRLFSKRFSICIFSAAAITLNYYILSINKLNPNMMGLLIVSILLYLIMSDKKSWLLIGLLYGVLGGARNVGIFFFPAIIYILLASSERKLKDLSLFVTGAIITILPILCWNHFAFGNPLMHPSQSIELEGFRPTFEHNFFFWKFNFNGMLNYPLYNRLIRTPYFPYPTFLMFPLILLKSFGIVISLLIFSGIAYLYKTRKNKCLFLLLWFLPIYMFFSVQENWSELKMTFLLLFLSPLVIFATYGLEWIMDRRYAAKDILRISSYALLLIFAIKLIFYAEFDADPRWYLRFPRILGSGEISFIGDDLRTKAEDADELLGQKKDLTKANIFPSIRIHSIDMTEALKKAAKEFQQKDISVVDFWKYIYEE